MSDVSVGGTIPGRNVAAASAVCLGSMAALLWMPSALGALAQGYGLNTRSLSTLAAFELAGFVLGTLVTGSRTGRADATQLTLYKSVGVAVEDAAAAALVLRLARERGVGKVIDL